MSGIQIPADSFGEKHRDLFTEIELRQGVRALQDMADRAQDGEPRVPWPAHLSIELSELMPAMQCVGAWWLVPRIVLVDLLDSIRTRVLNFALEIEAEDPEAGEAAAGEGPVDQSKVTQIFNTTISGGGNQVAIGGRTAKVTGGIRPGDLEALIEALRKTEAPAEDVDALYEVLGDTEALDAGEGETLPMPVQSWLERVKAKLQDAGADATVLTLRQLLGSFFGL